MLVFNGCICIQDKFYNQVSMEFADGIAAICGVRVSATTMVLDYWGSNIIFLHKIKK